jgi:hypothetical protein
VSAGLARRDDGTHLCPGCRDRRVPDHLFCCTTCWGHLSPEVQREIYRTARTSVLRDRSLAVQAARAEWDARRDQEQRFRDGEARRKMLADMAAALLTPDAPELDR